MSRKKIKRLAKRPNLHTHPPGFEDWKASGAPVTCDECGAVYLLLAPDAPERCSCGAPLAESGRAVCRACYDEQVSRKQTAAHVDSQKLTRQAYEQLIVEDLAWLDKQPRTLEREHIRAIVERSANLEYAGDESIDTVEIEDQTKMVAPGPWVYDGHCYIMSADGGMVAEIRGYGAEVSGERPPGTMDRTANFIAAAREKIPALARRLHAVESAARRLLDASNAEREATGRIMEPVLESHDGTAIAACTEAEIRWVSSQSVFSERQAAADALSAALLGGKQ